MTKSNYLVSASLVIELFLSHDFDVICTAAIKFLQGPAT